MLAEAIGQWERAGALAAARSTFIEAVMYWNRAAEAARTLVDQGVDRDAWERRELGLLMRAGSLTMVTKGTGSEEARRIYERARELSERVGTDEQRFVSVFDLWFNAEAQLRLDDAGQLIEQAVALARQSGDDRLMVQACHASFTTGIATGHFERTVADARDAYRRYPPVCRKYKRYRGQ